MSGFKARVRKISNDLGNKIAGRFKPAKPDEHEPEDDMDLYGPLPGWSSEDLKKRPEFSGPGRAIHAPFIYRPLYAATQEAVVLADAHERMLVREALARDQSSSYQDGRARTPRRARTTSTPITSAHRHVPYSAVLDSQPDAATIDPFSIASAMARYPPVSNVAPPVVPPRDAAPSYRRPHRRTVSNRDPLTQPLGELAWNWQFPPKDSEDGVIARQPAQAGDSQRGRHDGSSRPAPRKNSGTSYHPYVVARDTSVDQRGRTGLTNADPASRQPRGPSASLERSRHSNHKRQPSDRLRTNSELARQEALRAQEMARLNDRELRRHWEKGTENAQGVPVDGVVRDHRSTSRRPSYSRYVGEAAHVHQPRVVDSRPSRPQSQYPEVGVLPAAPPVPVPTPPTEGMSALGLYNVQPKVTGHSPSRGYTAHAQTSAQQALASAQAYAPRGTGNTKTHHVSRPVESTTAYENYAQQAPGHPAYAQQQHTNPVRTHHASRAARTYPTRSRERSGYENVPPPTRTFIPPANAAPSTRNLVSASAAARNPPPPTRPPADAAPPAGDFMSPLTIGDQLPRPFSLTAAPVPFPGGSKAKGVPSPRPYPLQRPSLSDQDSDHESERGREGEGGYDYAHDEIAAAQEKCANWVQRHTPEKINEALQASLQNQVPAQAVSYSQYYGVAGPSKRSHRDTERSAKGEHHQRDHRYGRY